LGISRCTVVGDSFIASTSKTYLAAMFVALFAKANNSDIKRRPITRCLWIYFFAKIGDLASIILTCITASSDGRTNRHGVSAEDSEEGILEFGSEIYTRWRINFISYSKLWLCHSWGEFLLLSGERRSGCPSEHSVIRDSQIWRFRRYLPQFCFLDRAFSIMKTKINQQNAQINSGLIYYWSITPTCFGFSVEAIIREFEILESYKTIVLIC